MEFPDKRRFVKKGFEYLSMATSGKLTLRGIPESQCHECAFLIPMSEKRRSEIRRREKQNRSVPLRDRRKPAKFTYLRLVLSSLDPPKRITVLRYIVLSSTYGVSPDFLLARRQKRTLKKLIDCPLRSSCLTISEFPQIWNIFYIYLL